VRVGITDHAQRQLGDVVLVELPAVGDTVAVGDACGSVESTKSVSDVYAPLSGTVAERNPLLEERPEVVNEEPYGEGWIVVLESSDRSELERLMDAAAYREFVRQQES
jgi:glycine cleavage system H protein